VSVCVRVCILNACCGSQTEHTRHDTQNLKSCAQKAALNYICSRDLLKRCAQKMCSKDVLRRCAQKATLKKIFVRWPISNLARVKLIGHSASALWHSASALYTLIVDRARCIEKVAMQ